MRQKTDLAKTDYWQQTMNNRATNYFAFVAFCSVLMLVTTASHGKAYQTSASISDAVKEFLSKDNSTQNFTIGRIDKRLRLTRCHQSLQTNFPHYAQHIGRTSVEVSCGDQKPWKILVSVYIKKYLNVLSLKNSLPSGSVIQASDIKLSRQEVSRIANGYFTSSSQVSNMVLRRHVKAGKILSPSMLKPRQLITRGDEILILAKSGNLSIRVKGKALMNGTLGQRIKVKNTHSRRVFQATVISNGLVKVNM